MSRQAVLIVEDDEAIATAIARALAREDYETAIAGTVADAREALARASWRAVILDLGLPDGDGLQIARQLSGDTTTPVLVVTARDEVPSRVAGLDAGADDYLVKPFDRAELLARLRALLRRSAPPVDDGEPTAIRVADLRIDRRRHTVHRGSREIAATPLEFELLVHLAARDGEPVSREALLAEVWHHDPREPTNTVEVFVSNLRRKLEAGGEPRLLKTIRGRGYALSA